MNFLWRPQLRDPADEFLLEAAANGQADAIVTHNVRDFMGATGLFGIRTLTPRQLIEEIDG